MHSIYRHAIRLLATLLFLPFLIPNASAETVSDVSNTLVIISTSDIHGNLSRFPKLASLVKQYRKEYRHVLLIDSGDFFSGNPFVDDYVRPGEPLTILMNKLGYDAGIIGAHDFNYGQEALKNHIKGMPKTRFVVTNVTPSPTLDGCFVPYTSISLKNSPITVGIIGLTDIQAADTSKTEGISWKITDSADYKNVTNKFRLSHNNLNIVISYLGYDHDQEIMRYTPNIDLILGGQSHLILPHGYISSGTLLSHSGHHLNYVGVTKIVFSKEIHPKIIHKSTESVSLLNYPDDPEYLKIVESYTSDKQFSEEIAEAKEDISFIVLGYYFCKAIQEAVQSDVALYNQNSVRLPGLEKGPITVMDVFAMEPFKKEIVTCRMTKSDIERLILNKYMSPSDDFGGRMELLCTGFSYKITDGIRPNISSTLKDDVVYTVAMSDYLCNNFDFPQQGEGKYTGKTVRQALLSYFSKIKSLINIPPTKISRVKKATYSV